MPGLSFARIAEFKSPPRVLAAVFLDSRNKHGERSKALREENRVLQRVLAKKDQQIASLEARVEALQHAEAAAQQDVSEPQENANCLPPEEPLPHHGYGVVELQEVTEQLKTLNKRIIVLRDIKHLAASLLETTVGKDERYREFSTKVSQTRCAIQQTELGHLTPPPGKTKARFRNLAPTLRWAECTLWLLDNPQAVGRCEI